MVWLMGVPRPVVLFALFKRKVQLVSMFMTDKPVLSLRQGKVLVISKKSPSPNPLPLKGERARTEKPSPCGRGLGEGLV